MAKIRNSVVFYLNGERHEVSGADCGLMLADYLRYCKGLTGTKIVCAEGDCGACSVLRKVPGIQDRYQAINACIITVAQMDGSSLVTVDALSEGQALTPVQNAMMKCHGSQCGFCTPGFVVALTDLVEKKLKSKSLTPITGKEAKNATTGNLCRCTGYKPILEAAENIELKKCESVAEKYDSKMQQKDLLKVLSKPVLIKTPEFEFYAPKTLKEACRYLSRNSDSKIIAAGTDLGVFHNKWKNRYQKLVSLHLISDLFDVRFAKSKIVVGARVTLADLRLSIQDSIPEFANFLDLFASPQIKNVATLVGNVANASPIGDTPAALLALDAEVEVTNGSRKKKKHLSDFYLGYRKLDMKKGEIISAIHIPVPKNPHAFAVYKSSQRKDLDISIVNLGAYVELGKKGEISVARFSVGGVAATPLRLKKTESYLLGKIVSHEVLAKATAILQSEMTPISDLRSDSQFRRVVAENFFLKYFRERNLIDQKTVKQRYLYEGSL